jgi:hypothetical protein
MIDLVMVLTLMALGDELPAQSGKSSKNAPPGAPAPAPVQDGERPSLSVAELKLLKDTNIFAPKGMKKRYTPSSRPSGGSKEPAVPAKPKPPVVTGIFFDAKADTFLVVVEDKNTDATLKLFKEPKFLKVGDEVVGFKVTSVTADKAVFLKGDVSKELKVGEPMPGADGKPISAVTAPEDPEAAPPPEGDEKVEIKPQDAETNNKTLDEMRKKVGKKNRPSRDE